MLERLTRKRTTASVTDTLKSHLHKLLDGHTDQIAYWTEMERQAAEMREEHYAAANAIQEALGTFVTFTGEDLLAGMDGDVRQISAAR